MMLPYTDVIVLQQYRIARPRSPFIMRLPNARAGGLRVFSVAAATAHKFSEYHVAATRRRSRRSSATRSKVDLLLRSADPSSSSALGKPFLWLFGPQLSTVS